MAKKIRFPLKLADNTQVRTLDELREHFDLETIVGYFKNGKLLTWLEDRYLEGEADAVRILDETAPDFQQKLCGLFQVEYTGSPVDLEAVARRQERLARLRTFTDEQEFIDHIDQVAFDQEDLADLLDEGTNTIYLCGEKFIVPASRRGICYVGVNHPAVHISGTLPKRREELEIEFRAVDCDNLPDFAVEVEAEVDHLELESSGLRDRIPQIYFEKPVYLDGVKYDHVPVWSVDIFNKLDLHVGSTVEVYRVGDVIPVMRKISTGDGPALVAHPARNQTAYRTEFSHDFVVALEEILPGIWFDFCRDGPLVYCLILSCDDPMFIKTAHCKKQCAASIFSLQTLL